ncbi:MAG: hypothetical protein HFJ12_00725 [Bacilli bacterium]|nr:hypothetical protein [Bacilli bacterium]
MKKYKCLLLLFIMMIGVISVNAAPCKVVKGSGEKIGDEISCGTENFYVIKVNQEKMVLLAKYNLKVGKNWFTNSTGVLQNVSVTGSDVGIQSDDCTTAGSLDGVSYIATCSEYATDEVKAQYFNNYYNYLKNTVKIMGNLTVLQPDMALLEQAGCKYTIYQEVSNIPTEDVNCQNSGNPFLYSTSYLLSKKVSIFSDGKVVLTEYPTLEQSGKSGIRTLPYGAGYRPVVIMKKDNTFEAKEISNEGDYKDSKKSDQIVDVKDTFKASYIGYCLGTIILILGIMVLYQEHRKGKIEIKIRDQ